MRDLDESNDNTLMKMNLISMSGCGFFLTFFVFLILLSSITILGVLFGPYLVDSVESDYVALAVPESVWVGKIDGLSKLNQQLGLSVAIENSLYESIGIEDSPLLFNISVYVRRTGDTALEHIFTEQREHLITCKLNETVCNTVSLVYESFVYFEYFEAHVNLVVPKEFVGLSKFKFVFTDHNFTLFELWFRYIYLILTFIIVVIFCFQLRGYSWTSWTVEQKWLTILLFALFGFNNPLFSLEILVEGWIFPFIDITLVLFFLTLLLLYILVLVDGMRKEHSERDFGSFYLPKFIFMGILFFATEGVFAYREFTILGDPATSESSPIFSIFMIAMPIALVAYLVWLTVSASIACSTIDKKPFLKRRLLFFLAMSLLVVVVIAGGIIFNIFQYQNTGAQFLTFHTLLNLYVYTLALVYSPSKQSQSLGYDRNFDIEHLDDENSGVDLDDENQFQLKQLTSSDSSSILSL